MSEERKDIRYHPKCFALVDCNNFYASCERVFQPKLAHQPVVVLSNNDGCIIARSNEAKRLGIPMGTAAHHSKDIIQYHHMHVFSANFSLYGDFSNRVMSVLRQFSPVLEVYSVDEAFMDLSLFPYDELRAYGQQIRQTLYQWLKLPVSIGIAPTKTLAKLASEWVKQEGHQQNQQKQMGVLALLTDAERQACLAQMPLKAVWGVGWKSTERLQAKGFRTALDLQQADERWILKHFNIVLLKVVQELCGIAHYGLKECPEPRKGILSSRSFRLSLTEEKQLREAVASYTHVAAEKLRRDHQAVKQLTVFIRTNRFRSNMPQYHGVKTVLLPLATNNTSSLIQAACDGLHQVFRRGYAYHKAGVYLHDLVPENEIQQHLWIKSPDGGSRARRLMQAVDHLNGWFGSGTLRYAAEGLKQDWRARAENRSNRYTTQWSELPMAY